MTTENGFRAQLTIDGFHDGPAGFQKPSAAEAGRGATLVAAFRPNRGKRPASSTAHVDSEPYVIVAAERSGLPGFHVVLLREV